MTVLDPGLLGARTQAAPDPWRVARARTDEGTPPLDTRPAHPVSRENSAAAGTLRARGSTPALAALFQETDVGGVVQGGRGRVQKVPEAAGEMGA